MHVTGGQYKGAKIITPECAKPTLSKTREAVFNVLYSLFDGNFDGRIFLDLYSGSGVMSLEALSRGFKTISIDKDKNAVFLIKQNLKIAKEDDRKILKGDSTVLIDKIDVKPDVVYIDPPWNSNYKEAVVKSYNKFKGAIIVIESDKKRMQELAAIYGTITAPFREKVYGRCKLDFIKSP